jgi:hypothetical protein
VPSLSWLNDHRALRLPSLCRAFRFSFPLSNSRCVEAGAAQVKEQDALVVDVREGEGPTHLVVFVDQPYVV